MDVGDMEVVVAGNVVGKGESEFFHHFVEVFKGC